ncbi:MAG: hypothetical protein KatS3mg031_1311 [Chitinophagales bacterium]|nr:MAG: hypothetical protein KatS3mg031_1311 [Chitinophagales bacterium]
MRQFLGIIFIVLACFSARSQCTPNMGITQVGFYPGDSLLACVEQGYYYDEVIQFKNFSFIDGSYIGLPGVTIIIDSVKIDSIGNFPSGLTYSCHNPGCVYTSGENGCVRVSGLTNDPPGVYHLNFRATLTIRIGSGGPIQFVADSQFLASNGLGYSLTVVAPGAPCPNTLYPGALYVNASINTGRICEGDTVPLHTHVSGGFPPYNFIWNPGMYLSDPNAADPLLYPTHPGIYTVVVSDGNGTTVSDAVEVTYGQVPVVTVSADTVICPGDSVQLFASGGTSYMWHPATGLSDAAVADPVAYPESTTSYTVTVVNENCSAQETVTITIDSLTPQASFNAIPNNFNVLFSNTSTGATGYYWDFGDGQTSTDTSPNHQYPQRKPYEVTLIAYGNCGRTDTLVYLLDLSTGVSPVSSATGFSVRTDVSGNILVENLTGFSLSILYTLHASDGRLVGSGDGYFGAGTAAILALPPIAGRLLHSAAGR